MWEYWCKAIGSKAFDDNNKADKVAVIRTLWILLHVVTCIAIIMNTWRHFSKHNQQRQRADVSNNG